MVSEAGAIGVIGRYRCCSARSGQHLHHHQYHHSRNINRSICRRHSSFFISLRSSELFPICHPSFSARSYSAVFLRASPPFTCLCLKVSIFPLRFVFSICLSLRHLVFTSLGFHLRFQFSFCFFPRHPGGSYLGGSEIYFLFGSFFRFADAVSLTFTVATAVASFSSPRVRFRVRISCSCLCSCSTVFVFVY